LQDRQVGWLGALEDAACINSRLAIGSGEACRIADQAARLTRARAVIKVAPDA
jgi:hypothetical protein